MKKMIMPLNYVELEQEEMMYLEGGWDWRVLKNNLLVLFWKAPSRAIASSGLTLSYINSLAYRGYIKIAASVSWRVGRIGAIIGGAIGATIGLAALAGATWYLGTYRKFY